MNDRDDFLHLFHGGVISLRHLTVLKKRGHPFLYLPGDRRMADATLRLYPAQKAFARSLVALIRGFMRFGIPVSKAGADFPVDEDTAFAEFLRRVMPGSKTVPNFGILANRLQDSGRPHLLLLFNAANQPAVVVKVGTSKEARRLIQVEQKLFFPNSPDFPGLPKALDQYDGDDATAIAYRYVEGANPKPAQHGNIASLLNSWIDGNELIRLADLSVWDRLVDLLQNNPGLEPILEALRDCRVKPVLAHGDFAPWNVRVPSSDVNSTWVILDWEHGVRRGIPGWDWIHFTLQYNTLVRQLSARATLSEIEALWKAPAFQEYARRTGIEPILKELTFLFLFYFVRYCDPRENAIVTHRLLSEFNWKYFPEIDPYDRPLKIHDLLKPHFERSPHYMAHA